MPPGQIDSGSRARKSSVVEDDVELSEFTQGGGDHGFNLSSVSDICFAGHGPSTARHD